MNSKNTKVFNIRKFGCLLKLHKFETIRVLSTEIKEVRCTICRKEFALYENISTIYPLDNELKAVHNGKRIKTNLE